MNPQMIRLTTGEIVVGLLNGHLNDGVAASEKAYTISKAMMIQFVQGPDGRPQPAFQNFPPFSDDKSVVVKGRDILYVAAPVKALKDAWLQATTSIITPGSGTGASGLILGS